MDHLTGIPINPDHVRGWPSAGICQALSKVFASTRFTFCAATGRVALNGPCRNHLNLDPDLHAICEAAGIALNNGTEAFHTSRGRIELCLEDGLSGLLMSRAIDAATRDDWIILHLDDHADMMPTHLTIRDGIGLGDPETGTRFRARIEQDWHNALARGTITIGSYLTALFHDMPTGCLLHVRHLRPRVDKDAANGIQTVRATTKTYPILGPMGFAALDMDQEAWDGAGTYLQSECIKEVLKALPPGRLIVHIDLDFFVNDFNGNPGTTPKNLRDEERAAVLHQMDQVFQGISRLKRPVERWIIATSPGFCAARHWRWLLDALNTRIGTLTGEEGQLYLG